MSPEKEEKKEKSKALDTLFPKRNVPLGEKPNQVIVEMYPIPVSDLPDVMDSFLKIALCKAENKPEAEIAIICMKEIVTLLPYSTEFPLKKIPHYAFPDLLEAFLDLNMTDELVKKWTALAERVQSVAAQSEIKA